MSTPADKTADQLLEKEITLIFSDSPQMPKEPQIKTRILKSFVNRLTLSEELIEKMKEDVAKLKYEAKKP